MSETWIPEDKQVYAGTVVSQEFFQARSGVVYFKITCRIEGKPVSKWDLKSKIEPLSKYEEVGVLFDFNKDFNVRDLEKFVGPDVEPGDLNPDKPGYLSLRDRRVHLTPSVKANSDGEPKIFWNLFQPDSKTTPKVPQDAIAALSATLKATKARLAQSEPQAVGAGSDTHF